MATTTKNITREQIAELRRQAASMGDELTVADCDAALHALEQGWLDTPAIQRCVFAILAQN